MTIRLLFFGALSEAISPDPEPLEVDEGLTLAALRELVARRHSAAAAQLERCMVAVNTVFVHDPGHVVEDGDEVAFLPPVSGG